MSGGACRHEDYNDKHFDVLRMSVSVLGRGGGLNGFVARMAKKAEPQTLCPYNSAKTQRELTAPATGRFLTLACCGSVP